MIGGGMIVPELFSDGNFSMIKGSGGPKFPDFSKLTFHITENQKKYGFSQRFRVIKKGWAQSTHQHKQHQEAPHY